MMSFDQASKLFKQEKVNELAADPDGLRFLKLRSLSRKESIAKLFDLAGISPSRTAATQMFREAYETKIDEKVIEAAIRRIYEEGRTFRRTQEPALVSELYKLTAFDWGGLHQNSLEKTIVDNYVKKITNFDTLCDKIENDLHNSMRGYVLCSWYNHWTSIIIEDVFRDHPNVLPAVGQVKKIDFFIRDIPFDLKVTYLPEGFLAASRRREGHRPELTLLRQSARRAGIHFDTDLPDNKLLEDLWIKLRDHPGPEVQELLRQLLDYRLRLVEECQKNSSVLVKWLYENQGIRRFDASNRLFLVLIDRSNFFDSWKLKRAKPLLDVKISSYLDSVPQKPGQAIEFQWEGASFQVLADVVFVVHP